MIVATFFALSPVPNGKHSSDQSFYEHCRTKASHPFKPWCDTYDGSACIQKHGDWRSATRWGDRAGNMRRCLCVAFTSRCKMRTTLDSSFEQPHTAGIMPIPRSCHGPCQEAIISRTTPASHGGSAFLQQHHPEDSDTKANLIGPSWSPLSYIDKGQWLEFKREGIGRGLRLAEQGIVMGAARRKLRGTRPSRVPRTRMDVNQSRLHR